VLIPAPVCVEEHEEARETITTGPYGEQTVTLSVEDDVHVHEAVGTSSSAIGLHGITGGGGPPCEPEVPVAHTYPPPGPHHHYS
jgi:hypothetical protein